MMNKIKKIEYRKCLLIIFSIICYLLLATHCLYAAGFSGDFNQPGGAVYDGGYRDDSREIAIDTITAGGPYIYVLCWSSAGVSSDSIVIKYNSNGIMITTATFHGVTEYDKMDGIDIDNSGNVYVTGETFDGVSTFYGVTIKYNSSLTMVSSDVVSGSSFYGIRVDKNSGYVYVTGVRQGGGARTVKYNSSLVVQSTVTFGSINGGDDVVVDNLGNVYICGNMDSGPTIVKYDSSLVFQASAVFDSGVNEQLYGIAVDNNGYVYVIGKRWVTGTYSQYLTVKYDSSLNFISYATIGNEIDSSNSAQDITIDNSGNVYVTGIENETIINYLTIKYSPSLVILSSAVFNTDGFNSAWGIAVDDNGYVYVTGHSGWNIGLWDIHTIRYSPSVFNAYAPALSWTGETGYSSDGLEPLTGTSTTTFTFRVKYTDGENDAPKSGYPKVHIKKGGIEISGSPFTMNYISGNYNTGAIYEYSISGLSGGSDYTYCFSAYDIAEATATGSPTTLLTGPTVYVLSSSTTVTASEEKTLTILPETGEVKITIPVLTFSETVNVSVFTVAVPSSDRATIKVTNIGVEITNDKGLQPTKEITITVNYRDSDVVGFDESKLVIGRYDETNKRWLPLSSTAYPEQNYVIGRTTHLSKFAIIQLVPATDLNTVKVYPNPFNPRKHTQGLTIDNLTVTADIKIYTIAGELVREVEYTAQNGKATWDGKNDAGKEVASGIYLGLIKSPGVKKKIVKIAVVR